MNWFRLVFPLVMILWPAVFSLFIRSHPDPKQDPVLLAARLSALRKMLWLGTAVAVVVFLLLYFYASAEVAYFMWVACFPLWFAGAMPLLREKDRGWQPVHQPETMPAATLVRRDVEPAGLRKARILAWGAWVGLVGVTLWAFATRGPGWQFVWTLMFPLAGGCWLAWGAHFGRLSMREPEPVDTSGSVELADGYAAFRSFKLWGWFVVSVLAMLAFCLPSLLLALDASGLLRPAIWVGAGGGSFAGVMGGVYGIRADLYRARLNRLYQDLS